MGYVQTVNHRISDFILTVKCPYCGGFASFSSKYEEDGTFVFEEVCNFCDKLFTVSLAIEPKPEPNRFVKEFELARKGGNDGPK